MSRSGYSEDYGDENPWALICYRGAVASAMRGARGQKLFREALAALDAMPDKRLISHEIEQDGCYCTLGAVGKHRGIDLQDVDPEAADVVARKFDIAEALAREIVWKNDECGPYNESPEQRWVRMRNWVARQIIEWEPTS
jgi:hypothetical protein